MPRKSKSACSQAGRELGRVGGYRKGGKTGVQARRKAKTNKKKLSSAGTELVECRVVRKSKPKKATAKRKTATRRKRK